MNWIKKQVVQGLKNIPGFHTKRKIVVIESDDWGSIRMPSRKAFENLTKKGLKLDNDRYNLYDNLANEQDLLQLFEVLFSVKDVNGSPAKFTPYSLSVNPDFEKIKSANFEQYFYKPLTETLKEYGSDFEKAFPLWKQGISEGFFVPQLHGREHLNVDKWLASLRSGSPESNLAFEEGVFGIPYDSYSQRKNLYMSAFEYDSLLEFDKLQEIFKEGADEFDKLLGYRAVTFMAPCSIWGRHLEKAMVESGLIGFQSSAVQYEPIEGEVNKYKKIPRYTGQTTKSGLTVTTRNISFEPSASRGYDEIGQSLRDIEMAFRWRKPAVITTHRVNYISNLCAKNGKNGLSQLKQLLTTITKKWPDVEFMTMDELLKMQIK
jgi:hypothetical protein